MITLKKKHQGNVPKNWDTRRLKFLVSDVRDAADQNANQRYLALENIESWTGKLINIDESMELDAAKEFRKGDVLFGKLRPYLAKVYKADYDGACVGELLVLRPKGEIEPEYLFYRLLSSDFISIVDNSTMGAKMPRAEWSFIGNLRFDYPKKDDQLSIASYLDEKCALIDRIIEGKKKQIEILEEQRAAIINRAVTRGLDGNVEMKESGVEWIGEIPKEWQVMGLKYGIYLQEGPGIMAVDFRESGTPLLRIGNLTTPYVTLDGCNYLDRNMVSQMWSQFSLNHGDLLISASATTGVVSEVNENSAGSIPYTGIIRIVPKNEVALKGYIKYFVISQFYLDQVEQLKSGSAMQHYGPTHMKKMMGLFPPLKVQQEIISHLEKETSAIDSLANILDRSIFLFSEYKTSLISHAVTGRVKIPTHYDA